MAHGGPIDVHTMFPVPLLMTRIEEGPGLNPLLAGEIAERRRAEAGIDRSNLDGWHSATDLFDRKEPGHRALAEAIRDFIDEANRKTMPQLPDDLVIRLEGWVHVNPPSAMNAPHDHSGAFWSGTYYIDVPVADDPADKYSGVIEFIDPRGSLGSSAQIETPFTKTKFTIRPAAGMLLLWPAYVKHWVHPNRSSRDRMTAAFNAWFARP